MGMDIIGANPANETGAFFRRSVWGWWPLWRYISETHPELASKVEHADSNDGDGLGALDSLLLATKLRCDLADGTAYSWASAFAKWRDSLEDETCVHCSGTGVRTDQVGVSLGMVEKKWCNGCGGKGVRRPFVAASSFEENDVCEFASFLEACGGFSIW